MSSVEKEGIPLNRSNPKTKHVEGLFRSFNSSPIVVDEKTIGSKDAAQHVGETVVIAEVHQFKGESIALDFGNPNELFEVYVPKT